MNVFNMLFPSKNKIISRRAEAPIISTLLLLAIAVVGGSMIFVVAQGFASSAQVSGQPQIESLEIVGYDASDSMELTLHDGVCSNGGAVCNTVTFDGQAGNGMLTGERIAIYVQNQSTQKVTMTEVRVAGTLYNYSQTATLPANSQDDDGVYYVILKGDPVGSGPGIGSPGIVGELEAGQEATIIVDLLGGIQQGRDAQFKITTSNGATFVSTVYLGHYRGDI